MKSKIAIAVVVLVAIIISITVFIEKENEFFWEFVDQENDVYIGGTIHFMPENTFPLSESIEQAFVESDVLFVEKDLLSIDRESREFYDSQHGYFSDGETLADYISDELYHETDVELEKVGIPIEGVDKLRPWYMAEMLEMSRVTELDYELDDSVELYFMQKAEEKGMEIIELESYFDYLDRLFETFTLEKQHLKATVKKDQLIEDRLYKVLEAWKNGDKDKMEDVVLAPREEYPELEEYYQKLYDERNVELTEKIIEVIENREDEDVFVVLNAAHLVGENGVLNILEEKGYELKQL